MQVKKVKVAVIGCGTICKRTYLPNMMNLFHILDVVGCADLIDERAQAMADEYGIRKMTNEEIYNDPEIEIVVNLTYPESHFEVSKAAMEHGKHVYCEKMMACDFAEATELMRIAKEKGVLFTTAPDTFLGAWEQSARFYLDAGLIGKPVSIHAQHTCSYRPGGEKFDLSPDTFFFPLHRGGGLPFDWGGYYLHTMINLLGSMTRVAGFGGNCEPVMQYTHPRHPKYKEDFVLDTPTSLWGALEFECGAHGTFHITSDASMTEMFEITGTEGTLVLGNPNFFNSNIILRRGGIEPAGDMPITFGVSTPSSNGPGGTGTAQFGAFSPIGEMRLPILHSFGGSCRGVGLADMAYALRNGRRARAHCDIGYHAIEVIHGILQSGKTGTTYAMSSRCPRPAPLRAVSLPGTAQEAVLDD